MAFVRDAMFLRFRLYGFLKNLRFFDPFLILFLHEMGMSYLEIGVLYSIREVATTLLEIPTGVLADAFGRRKAMLASFACYVMSFVIFYAVAHFAAYAGAMVLFGCAEAFRSGTHKAMILEYLRLNGWEDEKIAYYGYTRAASQFGSALAAVIAAGLVFYGGAYRIVFLASTVPYLLGFTLILTYPRGLDGEKAASDGKRRTGVHRVAGTAREFLRTLRSPALLRGLVGGAGFDALFKSTKDYLQPILQAQALALPILVGLGDTRRVAVVVGALYCALYMVSSYASSRAGRISPDGSGTVKGVNRTYLTALALLVGSGAAAWAGIPGLAIACYVAVYAMQNLRRPLVVGYLSDLLPHRAMATGLSVESQLRTFLMAGLAPLLGFLADRFGVGAALVFLAGGGLLLFPIVRARTT